MSAPDTARSNAGREPEGAVVIGPPSGAIPTTKCVGAFLRPCQEQTDTILCTGCYAVVERELQTRRMNAVRASRWSRRVYRRRTKAA